MGSGKGSNMMGIRWTIETVRAKGEMETEMRPVQRTVGKDVAMFL